MTTQQGIPALVFFNHFEGLRYHLAAEPPAPALARLRAFRQGRGLRLTAAQQQRLEKSLLLAWNSEYSLRATGRHADADFLRGALYWSFPQAYYAVLYGVRAMLTAFRKPFGRRFSEQHFIGKLVREGYYPAGLGFYAEGSWEKYVLHRLPLGRQTPSLDPVQNSRQAQGQIGQFLKTTRRLQLRQRRAARQQNPATALKTRSGTVLERFDARAWAQVAEGLPATTFLDVMARLPISGTHREIERFVEAEGIDFVRFHEALVEVVAQLNTVHEAYAARALGAARYRQLLAGLPARLRGGFMEQRFHAFIEPLLQPQRLPLAA